jgi:multiple sugar transport system ATP-binding protein
VDSPQRLYDLPANVFVAAFIGSPSMNLYDGELSLDGQGGGTVQLGSQTVALDPESMSKRPALNQYDGKHIVVGIRPEDFEDAAIATGAPENRRMQARVKLVEALGSELMVHMSIDAPTVNSGDPDAPQELPGEGASNAVARFSPRSKVVIDHDVQIVVASEHMHFFDGHTHEAIWS